MILDSQGQEIRRFRPEPKMESEMKQKLDDVDPNETFLTVNEGLNRFVWNMRYTDAQKVSGDQMLGKAITGPLAAPGHYQVRLIAGEKTFTLPFDLKCDPRVQATPEDLQAQFELWSQINEKLDQTHGAINRIRKIRTQVKVWQDRLASLNGARSELDQQAQSLSEKLTAIESELIQVDTQSPSDRLRLPCRLNAKLAELIAVLSSADTAPPQQVYEVYDHISGLIDQQLQVLDSLVQTEVSQFNEQIKTSEVPAILA